MTLVLGAKVRSWPTKSVSFPHGKQWIPWIVPNIGIEISSESMPSSMQAHLSPMSPKCYCPLIFGERQGCPTKPIWSPPSGGKYERWAAEFVHMPFKNVLCTKAGSVFLKNDEKIKKNAHWFSRTGKEGKLNRICFVRFCSKIEIMLPAAAGSNIFGREKARQVDKKSSRYAFGGEFRPPPREGKGAKLCSPPRAGSIFLQNHENTPKWACKRVIRQTFE